MCPRSSARLQGNDALGRSSIGSGLILIVDRTGRVLFAHELESDKGSENLVGTLVWDRLAGEHREDMRRAIDHIFRTERPVRRDYTSQAADSAPTRQLMQIAPIRTDRGFDSALVIARDITGLTPAGPRLASGCGPIGESVVRGPGSPDKAGPAGSALPRDAGPQRRGTEADLLELKRLQTHLEDLVRERTAQMELEIEGRRKIEEELRLSEAKFALAFHSSPVAFLISSADEGRVMEANQGFCRMFGYGPDDLWSRATHDLSLFSSSAVEQEIAEALRVQGRVDSSEVQLRRRSGQVFWALLSIEIITLKGEECRLSMILDIDEQKRAAEMIRASEERFKVLFECAPDGYLLTERSGFILDCNRKSEELMGLPKSEIIGRNFFDLRLLSADQVPLATDILLKDNRSPRPAGPGELILTRKDGTAVTVEILGYPVNIQNRTVVLTVARDISERRKAAREREHLLEELSSIGQRLRWALQAGPGGAWDWDLINDLAWWSPEMYELCGVPLGTLMTRDKVLAMIHPDDRQMLRDNSSKSIAEHTPPKHEFRIVHPDGGEKWLSNMARVIYDETGRATRMIGISLDITERKKQEAKLKRQRENLENEVRKRTEDLEKSRRAALSLMQDANIQRQRAELALEQLARSEYELIIAKEQAESANKAKSAFLATMSHEIRTPINAVVGLAYLALKADPTARQSAYLQKILNSTTSLQKIIDETLDFSKIEAGRLEVESVNFGLEEVLEDVASVVHGKAQTKALKFQIVTDSDVPRALRGDPYRLKQVLLNLADNAIKFTAKGGVTVRTRLERVVDGSAVLRFSVKDTGIGMTDHEMARLFRPFTQADATTTRKYGGTGLGLAICKRLVEMMNGEISVRSQPDQGCEFEFTAQFGLAQGQVLPAQGRDLRAAGAHGALSGVKVLLVEDDEINRDVGRELLESEGLAVDVAENGQEAVNKVEPGKYDLVLMDIQMPVMDGIEATRLIRRRQELQDLPILSMTADVRADGLESCRRAGMNDNIAKPIDPERLFGTLAKWVKPQPWVLTRGRATPEAEKPAATASGMDGLPGLDTGAGLARVSGNIKLYRKILLKFRARYKHAISSIQKAVENRDLEQARRQAHTLKGVAGNVGAQELYAASNDLDQVLRQGSIRDRQEALASLSRAISTVMDSIGTLEEEAASGPQPKRDIDLAALTPLLREMLRLALASDLDVLDLLPEFEKLLGGAEAALTQSVREALEQFRFEEALAFLTGLGRRMKIPLEGEEKDHDPKS